MFIYMRNFPKIRHWAIMIVWWLGAQYNMATQYLDWEWTWILFISMLQAFVIYGTVHLLTFLWRKVGSYMPSASS